MRIRELGYIVVGSSNLAAWREYGAAVLGMMPRENSFGGLSLKMDGRAFRLLVLPRERDGLLAAGWLVEDESAWAAVRLRLQEHGVTVRAGHDPRATRGLQNYFEFQDPSGNRHEVGWGPISDFARFVSPVGVPAFVTGEQGLGHVALPAKDNFRETLSLFTDVLAFGISDILYLASGGAQSYFLHAENPRQHSLVLAPLSAPGGCFHIMVQVPTIDEVGYALDRATAGGVRQRTTLGRHVNDDMVSFYMDSPGGFGVEYGTGGLVKDWDRNLVFETTRGSLWGHRPIE